MLVQSTSCEKQHPQSTKSQQPQHVDNQINYALGKPNPLKEQWEDVENQIHWLKNSHNIEKATSTANWQSSDSMWKIKSIL